MGFSERAKSWDTPERVVRSKAMAEEIYQRIRSHNGGRVLDFGGGTGLISCNLKFRFREIIVADTSVAMIEQLKMKIRNHKMTSIKGHILGEEGLTQELGQFDAIYSHMVLHHIPDVLTTLRQLYQRLEEGGTICLIDLDEEDGTFHEDFPGFNGHNGFSHEEMKDLLGGAGFRNIKIKTFFRDVKKSNGQEIPYSLFIVTAMK